MDTAEIPSTKRCTKCNQEYPTTLEFWVRQKKGKYGLRSNCKKCGSTEYKAYRSQRETQERRAEYLKTYRQTTKGRESRQRGNQDYYSNPENLERKRAYSRAYNKTAFAKERKAILRNKPEAQEKQRTYNRNRRARKKAVKGNYTPQQIQQLLESQKYRCYYAACGHEKFEVRNGRYVYEIEHTYPLSRAVGTDIPANDIGYIVLACPSCNDSKGTKLPHEWPEGGRLL